MANIQILKVDRRYLFKIGIEEVEISDYKVQCSADGETELLVRIKGISNELELKASLVVTL